MEGLLEGEIRYKRGGKWYKYKVIAKDTYIDTKLRLRVSGGNYIEYIESVENYDKVEKEGGIWEDEFKDKRLKEERDDIRRLDVKKGNKYKSNILNKDMCIKVSSLLRYAQTVRGDVVERGVGAYRHNLGEVGYIEKELGILKEVSLKGKYVEIELERASVESIEGGEFTELKLKDKYGNILTSTPVVNVAFKLDESTLGFEYIPMVAREPLNLLGVYSTLEEVKEAHPNKDVTWLKGKKYQVVKDNELEEVLKEYREHEGVIAFDTETTGLNITYKSRDNEGSVLVGVVLSKKVGTGHYFPLQHKLFDNLCGGDHIYFMEKYMRGILEKKRIVCHNMQYDWKVGYIYDIKVNVVYDTMIALQVTKKYEEPTFEVGLKSVVKTLFNIDMLDIDDFIIGGSLKDSDVAFWDLSEELVRQYACADADMTLALYEWLEGNNILNKYNARKVFELELEFARVASYSEFYGYHVKVEGIPKLNEEILGNMEKYKQEMFKILGREFNPNSPSQLVPIIYDELGIEPVSGGGERSTKKEVLKPLAKIQNIDGSPRYPFIVSLLNYRQNEGIYKNFLKRYNEYVTEDGFIFPSVFTLGTTTGRCSIKEPNYQSYNDTVKKYITPRPGYIMFDSDFSQIEYRVLASMAGQESLMKAFDDADLDYHQYQASRMFNVPYALVTPELRQQSKGVNFGLPYGMGDRSLGANIYGVASEENTRKASQLRKKFFEGQEKIEQFFQRVRNAGVREGYTSTLFGRRRYYQKGKFSEWAIRRQAGNHVIQGTAADIYKLAVVNLFKACERRGWLGKVLFNAFVHDELLMEVHSSINMYEFIKVWRDTFELKIENFCRLYSGIGCGFSWYNAKKEDFPPQYLDEIIEGVEVGKYKEWDGDIEKFREEIYEGFEEHKYRRLREYITNKELEGEVIKPALNKLLEELSGKVRKKKEEEGVNIEELGYDEKGFEGNIKVMCDYYGIRREDVKVVETREEEGVIEEEIEEEEYEEKIDKKLYIELVGYYVEEDMLYLKNKGMLVGGNIKTTTIAYLYQKGVFKEERKGYRLVVVEEGAKEGRLYNLYVSVEDYNTIIRPLYSRI